MIDPSDIEKQCMERTLQPLGEVVAEIGMHKPLAEYTRAEVLTLIEVVVGNYLMYLIQNQPRHEDTEIPF
ncbi:MAG: DUF6511 domain-containing protein [Pseudomonadota bacterium]